MKVVNKTTATIDYRSSRRRFGLPVSRDHCQIIVPLRAEWTSVGPQLELSLEVPSSPQDLSLSNDVSGALRVAAFRYELLEPGTDLLAVLMGEKTFEKAMWSA